jgi:hypothetical protein
LTPGMQMEMKLRREMGGVKGAERGFIEWREGS